MPTQNPYDPVSRGVTDADNMPPARPTAYERFEKMIRHLMAEGYTEAEIEGGLQQVAMEYVRG